MLKRRDLCLSVAEASEKIKGCLVSGDTLLLDCRYVRSRPLELLLQMRLLCEQILVFVASALETLVRTG